MVPVSRSMITMRFLQSNHCARRANPRHAAASYAHLELLAYLLTVGGDINLTDDEGETPLFTVETMEAAQFLVAQGANVSQQNEEGQNVRRSSLTLSHPNTDRLTVPKVM
jgi:ankyrin repeat protein